MENRIGFKYREKATTKTLATMESSMQAARDGNKTCSQFLEHFLYVVTIS
jgi:hypothetical protein